ncbi:MAG: SagB/ThcOx family dehydrogenase [Blastocatellia bacterium]
MKQSSSNKPDARQQVFEYHQATKHYPHRYAASLGYMDWANQPNPFRRYEGAPLIALEKIPPTDEPLYDEAFAAGHIRPAAVNLRSLSQLFFDSLAISAWKRIGEVSWALRVNPSSGNLHPTEGYLICGPLPGLSNHATVCHYAAKEHGLERRAELTSGLWDRLCARLPKDTLLIGLTSIHWREAWKYGQRAYRYCQHDVGHAIGALSVAAAGLGWQTRILDNLGTDDLALLTGTFRDHDAEAEEPDAVMAVGPFVDETNETGLPEEVVRAFESLDWRGRPNQLSKAHVEWGMDEIAAAARKPRGAGQYERLQRSPEPESLAVRPISLRQMVRQRRSAVAMDGRTRISRETFYRILQRTQALPGNIPFSTLPWKPRIHLAIFVHRVDDLAAGLYLLVRDPSQREALEVAFTQADRWRRPPGCPEQLELYCLIQTEAGEAARQISCSQAIASDGCFSLGMIAEYEEAIKEYGAWFYPRLYWEAGVIGQVLYLEAEAAGIRSTGIGCYFDDPMHELLGLKDRKYQDLYHFTIGGAVEDTRLTTVLRVLDPEAGFAVR